MGTQQEQQFCLRWNNHQTNMLNMFDCLLQNETLVDVTLACEGVSLRAHKVVLSACSPYFQSLFVENPCKHPIVILRDVALVELKALIDFMYKGEVNVSQEKLPGLLKTAEHLKVKGLSEVSHGQPSSTNESETIINADNKQAVIISQEPSGSSHITPNSPLNITGDSVGSPVTKRKKMHHRTSESQSGMSDNEDIESLNLKGSPEVVEARVDLPHNLGDETPQMQSRNAEDDMNVFLPSPEEMKDVALTQQDPRQEDDVNRVADMPYSTHNPGMMVACLPSTSASQYNRDSPLAFVKSQKGHDMLVYQGFTFRKEKCVDNKVFWRCSEYLAHKCYARCHTSGDKILKEIKSHTHNPNIDKINAKQIIYEMKEKSRHLQTHTSKEIVDESVKELPGSACEKLPSVTQMKKIVQRYRDKKEENASNQDLDTIPLIKAEIPF